MTKEELKRLYALHKPYRWGILSQKAREEYEALYEKFNKADEKTQKTKIEDLED